jgi:HepT-like protein
VIPRYQVFRERITTDLGDVRRAAEKAMSAFRAAKRGGPDETFYLDSAALNLHGFYNGVERLFEWLAREIDGTVPSGASWHRELLAQLELAVPAVRPAVIGPTTRAGLEEYLRFRHLVRNLYTCDFAPAKMQELIDGLPSTLQALEADLDQFRQFLAAAAQADETGD